MAEQTDAQRLTETADMLMATVENGPWVLITDPRLRKVVGEYVADTCHSVALAAGLDEAMERAHDATPQRLDTVSELIAPDARERLARHLFIDATGGGQLAGNEWDGNSISEYTRNHWLGCADAALAVITDKEN